MFRFTIRELLLLTLVVALAVSWWIDNKRIENRVVILERERNLLEANFADRMEALEYVEKIRDERWARIVKRSLSTSPPEKPRSQ